MAKINFPKAFSLFEFESIECKLMRSTKSLYVFFRNEFLTTQTLFELEGLFNWLSDKIEIACVAFSGESETFGQGFRSEEIASMDRDKLNTLYEKIQKLTVAMIYLPQTFIFDLGQKCVNEHFSLSLGADLRLANENIICHLNGTKRGTIPTPTLFLLENLVGKAELTNLTLFERPLENKKDFFNFIYPEGKTNLYDLTYELSSISQIGRIQLKKSFTEPLINKISDLCSIETNNFKALHLAQDWQRENEFLDPREIRRMTIA